MSRSTLNEYVYALGDIYAMTPKAVLAAICVSFASRGEHGFAYASAEILREWEILHQNGIIPQPPPISSAEESDIISGAESDWRANNVRVE